MLDHRKIPCRLFLMSLLFLMCIPTLSWAKDTRKVIGILDLDTRSTISKEFIEEGSQSIETLIREDPRLSTMYTSVLGVSLSSQAMLMGCVDLDEDCLEQVAKNLQADLLIYGETSLRDNQFSITLRLYDPSKKTATISTLPKQEKIRASRFSRHLQKMAAEILGFPSNGQLVVETNIPGAEIIVSGERLGKGNLSKELAPGNYTLEIEAPDHIPYTQAITIDSGETETLTIALAPLQLQKPIEKPSGNGTLRWVGLSATAAGTVLGGLWLINIGTVNTVSKELQQTLNANNRTDDPQNARFNFSVEQKLKIQSDLEALGESPLVCSRQLRSIIKETNSSAAETIAKTCWTEPLGIPAIVLGVGGLSMLVLSTSTSQKGKEKRAKKQVPVLLPYVSYEGAGVNFLLRF